MQRTLRVMKAIATDSVKLASYRVQDVAVNWYESWELYKGENAPPAVWQEFTEAFLHHYLPPELRRARIDRFLTLRQGDMSVREYNHQFDLLARYAPTISSKMEDRAYAQGVEERKQKQRADHEHDRVQIKRVRSSGSFGSTLSYVTLLVAIKFGIKPELVKPFEVSTHVGDSVIAMRVYRDCIIVVHGRSTVADLIELDMVEFDAIMGMDWLDSCHTNIDYGSKIVRFQFPGEPGAKFQWTNAYERSFQALKDRLTSAPVLTLPEETDGYVIYCDASSVGLGCVLMKHGKVVAFASKQLRKHEKNYPTHDSCTKDVEALLDTATSSLVTEVKKHQYENPVIVHYRDTTPQKEKTPFEITEEGVLRYRGRLCVPNVARLRWQVIGETHYSHYSIHPGATKMYHDIRKVYWWDGMKRNIAEFVAQCPNCRHVKIEHQKPGGLLQAIEIPTWKWEAIEKIKLIQERLLAAQSRQKSYANNRR
ncbi:uncharacterized protein [Nicotiana tomentosiformis]|uniref:uncharacterized protein n=1 Tax=Nicotiana tomentosiformis TaxID=4098 RepID=UPI00388CDA56